LNLDGGKIKSLDALDRKKYINLTELQLSNYSVIKAITKFKILARFLL